jgi:hypothetical protein
MVAPQRIRPIAIKVMVTAQEQAELQKAADRAAMPVSVYVRSKALGAARRDTPLRHETRRAKSWSHRDVSRVLGPSLWPGLRRSSVQT